MESIIMKSIENCMTTRLKGANRLSLVLFSLFFLSGWGLFCNSTFCYGLQPTTKKPADKAVESPYAEQLSKANKGYQQGNFKSVIQISESILSQDSENHAALYLLGSAQIENGIRTSNVAQVRKGIQASRKAISLLKELQPNYYMPYLYGMTNLSMMEGKEEHAKVAVQVATAVLDKVGKQLTPAQRANFLFQRGMARLQTGNFDETILDYQAALKATPKHMGVMMAMADAYVAAGKMETAKLSFDSVVKEFPNVALAHNNRGMFLQQAGKAEDSINDFTRAITLDSKMFVALTNRGFAHLSLKDAKKAERDFTMSLAIEPNQPSTYSLRGTSRLNQGKPKLAKEDYEKVLQFTKKNPLAYADLGFANFFAKDYKQSAKAFDSALEIDAKMIYLKPWRYASKILSGDMEGSKADTDALSQLEKKDLKWPDRLTLYLMGRVPGEELISSPGDDIKGNEKALAARKCEAYYFIGQRTFNLGKTEKAKEYFKKAIATGASDLSAYRGAQYALGVLKGNE